MPREPLPDPGELTEAHEVPIHPSLLRPILWLGVERDLVFFELLVVLLVVLLTDYRLSGMLVAAGLGAVLHATGLWLARRDPVLAAAYVRSRRYADYYPARAHRLAPSPPVRYPPPGH